MGAIWQHGLSAFRDWANWRKLEPCLRSAIAARDLDMAACYCDRYPMTAVTAVIAPIIREMKASQGLGLSQLARIKRAWRSASKTQLSRLSAPIKYLQAVALVSPLAALCVIALDAAQYYEGPHHCFAPVEIALASNLPLLIGALSISVLCFLVQQNVERRVRELRRIIDDLATDLIVSFLEDGGKAVVAAYHAGKWMQTGDARSARDLGVPP